MGLRINQNIAAQNAYRNLSVTDNQMSKSLEKLSSGFRINRAADDAAGLSISEGLRSQTGGLKVAVRNAQDAISVVQTAEGALNETTSMLQRMRDLSVQANNASLDKEAKGAAQAEFAALRSEIDRVSETTAFGKSKLLDGSFGNTQTAESASPLALTAGKLGAGAQNLDITKIGGKDQAISVSVADADGMTPDQVAAQLNEQLATKLKDAGLTGDELSVTTKTADNGDVTFEVSGPKSFEGTGIVGNSSNNASKTPGDFQIGANSGETLNINIKAVDSKSLGLNGLDLTATADPVTGKTGAAMAMEAIDKAITSVSDQRAKLGASQNRFEHTINNLNTAVENLSASESRIRDTDMAQEMVAFTRNQILTQAGTSMLSQANQSSQGVMSLLR